VGPRKSNRDHGEKKGYWPKVKELSREGSRKADNIRVALLGGVRNAWIIDGKKKKKKKRVKKQGNRGEMPALGTPSKSLRGPGRVKKGGDFIQKEERGEKKKKESFVKRLDEIFNGGRGEPRAPFRRGTKKKAEKGVKRNARGEKKENKTTKMKVLKPQGKRKGGKTVKNRRRTKEEALSILEERKPRKKKKVPQAKLIGGEGPAGQTEKN